MMGPTPWVSVMLFLLPLLTDAIPVPYTFQPPSAGHPSTYPRPVWHPTADLFYHRCSSPTQVEFSKNQLTWAPSAICMRGTCCSNLAKGPVCSVENCALVDQEMAMSEQKQSAANAAKTGSSTSSGAGSLAGTAWKHP